MTMNNNRSVPTNMGRSTGKKSEWNRRTKNLSLHDTSKAGSDITERSLREMNFDKKEKETESTDKAEASRRCWRMISRQEIVSVEKIPLEKRQKTSLIIERVFINKASLYQNCAYLMTTFYDTSITNTEGSTVNLFLLFNSWQNTRISLTLAGARCAHGSIYWSKLMEKVKALEYGKHRRTFVFHSLFSCVRFSLEKFIWVEQYYMRQWQYINIYME